MRLQGRFPRPPQTNMIVKSLRPKGCSDPKNIQVTYKLESSKWSSTRRRLASETYVAHSRAYPAWRGAGRHCLHTLGERLKKELSTRKPQPTCTLERGVEFVALRHILPQAHLRLLCAFSGSPPKIHSIFDQDSAAGSDGMRTEEPSCTRAALNPKPECLLQATHHAAFSAAPALQDLARGATGASARWALSLAGPCREKICDAYATCGPAVPPLMRGDITPVEAPMAAAADKIKFLTPPPSFQGVTAASVLRQGAYASPGRVRFQCVPVLPILS